MTEWLSYLEIYQLINQVDLIVDSEIVSGNSVSDHVLLKVSIAVSNLSAQVPVPVTSISLDVDILSTGRYPAQLLKI